MLRPLGIKCTSAAGTNGLTNTTLRTASCGSPVQTKVLLLPQPSASAAENKHTVAKGDHARDSRARACGVGAQSPVPFCLSLSHLRVPYPPLPPPPPSSLPSPLSLCCCRIFPGVVEYIQRLRSQGCRIVLVTGSPDFLVAPLAELLGTGKARGFIVSCICFGVHCVTV